MNTRLAICRHSLPDLQKHRHAHANNLLVEGLGVGGGGSDVGIAGSLVGTSGELELVGSLEVGVAGLAVGTGVVLEVKELADHLNASVRTIQVHCASFSSFKE